MHKVHKQVGIVLENCKLQEFELLGVEPGCIYQGRCIENRTLEESWEHIGGTCGMTSFSAETMM